MTEPTEPKKRNWVDIENDSDDDDDEDDNHYPSSSQPQEQQQQPQQPVTLLKKTSSNNDSNQNSNYSGKKGNYRGDNRRQQNRGSGGDRYNNGEDSRRPPRENYRNEFEISGDDLRKEIEAAEGDSITFKIGKTTQPLTNELIQSAFAGITLEDISVGGGYNSFYKVKVSREDALSIVGKDLKEYPFGVRIWLNMVPSGAGQKKRYNEKGGKGSYGEQRYNNEPIQYNKGNTNSELLITPENHDEQGFSYVMNNKRNVDEDSNSHQGQQRGGQNKFTGNNNNNNRRNNDNRPQQEDGIIMSRNANNKPIASNNTPATNNKPIFSNSQRDKTSSTNAPATTISRQANSEAKVVGTTTVTSTGGAPKMSNSKKDAQTVVAKQPDSAIEKQRGIGDQDSGNDNNDSAGELEDIQPEKQNSVDIFENPNRQLNDDAENNVKGTKTNNNKQSNVDKEDKPFNNNNNKKKNNYTYERKSNNNNNNNGGNQGEKVQQNKQQQKPYQNDNRKKTGKPANEAPPVVQSKKNQPVQVSAKNVFGYLSNGSDDEDDQ